MLDHDRMRAELGSEFSALVGHWDNEEFLPRVNSLYRNAAEFLSKAPHSKKWAEPAVWSAIRESVSRPCFDVQRTLGILKDFREFALSLALKPWLHNSLSSVSLWMPFQTLLRQHLGSVDELYAALGFQVADDGQLRLRNDASPHPQIALAFDLFLAYVELQLMEQVHATLVSGRKDASWPRILRARESSPGNVEQTVSKLGVVESFRVADSFQNMSLI